MTPLPFKIENCRVDPFVCRYHCLDRKTLPDAFAAGVPIDFGKPLQRLRRLFDIVDKKSGLAIRNYLTARTVVHRNHGYTRGIGFRENKPESLRHRI